MHYLKFSAFSVPQSNAYHLNCRTAKEMCTTVGFDAIFDSERTFLIELLLKVVKNSFPQDLSTLRDFLSYCQNNKSILGFVTPIGLPGEAVEIFLRYTGS